MVYMYHSFLVHSSADGHLGCFHVLAMINSAQQNVFIGNIAIPGWAHFEMQLLGFSDEN